MTVPVRLDFVFVAGDDFSYTYNRTDWTEPETPPVAPNSDISNAVAEMRSAYDATEADAAFEIDDTVDGELTLTLGREDTEELLGTYFWDLEYITVETDLLTTYAAGTVRVLPQVSRQPPPPGP